MWKYRRRQQQKCRIIFFLLRQICCNIRMWLSVLAFSSLSSSSKRRVTIIYILPDTLDSTRWIMVIHAFAFNSRNSNNSNNQPIKATKQEKLSRIVSAYSKESEDVAISKWTLIERASKRMSVRCQVERASITRHRGMWQGHAAITSKHFLFCHSCYASNEVDFKHGASLAEC